jgi:hypothetical protein
VQFVSRFSLNLEELARKVIPILDGEGGVREDVKPFLSASLEPPFIELAVHDITVRSRVGGVPTSWRVSYTFSNGGDAVGRVTNSSIKLIVKRLRRDLFLEA